MIVRVFLSCLFLMISMASAAVGQVPVAPPAPAQPGQRVTTPQPTPNPQTKPVAMPPVSTAIAPPARQGQPVNIKVELTISDKRSSGGEALRKTVTVVTADAVGAYIRSTASYSNIGAIPLNVDVDPQIIGDGKIKLRVNVQYDLPAVTQSGAVGTDPTNLRSTQIHENLTLILENGKPVVAAQSADPVGDRQVTIEVKATVLR